jgi:hypothetical protein
MKPNQKPDIKWYQYVFALLSGMFLANSIPHYVQGISGNAFPSPFGNPPGLGSSSPTSNVLWGAVNLLLGYVLLRLSKIDNTHKWKLLILFFGIILQGVMLSLAFSHKI